MSAEAAREQLLTFSLAGDELAASVLRVREVVACGPITRVPSTPPFLRGATNLRGRAIPVVDLALKLGFPETVMTRWTCLLIVQVDIDAEPTLLGVLVDEVRELIERAPSEIEPPPAFGARVHPAYLRGLVRAGDRLVLVLDLERVLSRDELLVAVDAPRATAPTPDRPESKP